MDERSRELLERSFETIARIDAHQADWEAEREQREAYEPQTYERQPKVRRRTMYDATEYEQAAAAASQMDRETEAHWNAWANALVQAKLEAFAEVLGAEVGQLEKRFNEKLKLLEDKVAALTAQLEQLENLRSYNVTQLPLPLRSASNGS